MEIASERRIRGGSTTLDPSLRSMPIEVNRPRFSESQGISNVFPTRALVGADPPLSGTVRHLGSVVRDALAASMERSRCRFQY